MQVDFFCRVWGVLSEMWRNHQSWWQHACLCWSWHLSWCYHPWVPKSEVCVKPASAAHPNSAGEGTSKSGLSQAVRSIKLACLFGKVHVFFPTMGVTGGGACADDCALHASACSIRFNHFQISTSSQHLETLNQRTDKKQTVDMWLYSWMKQQTNDHIHVEENGMRAWIYRRGRGCSPALRGQHRKVQKRIKTWRSRAVSDWTVITDLLWAAF